MPVQRKKNHVRSQPYSKNKFSMQELKLSFPQYENNNQENIWLELEKLKRENERLTIKKNHLFKVNDYLINDNLKLKQKIKNFKDEELLSDDIIIKLIREKFKFSKNKPLTIIWRVDEAQNIIFEKNFDT